MILKNIIMLFSITMVFMLSGCDDVEVYKSDQIEVVELEDGVRCAIFTSNGYNGVGGISCDWDSSVDVIGDN